jgi:Zn finger protein HypA/HybF involved in hydrogenase expression
MDRYFICGECGQMGHDNEIEYFKPPNGEYFTENEAMQKILQKNDLSYAGCPECQSPNVYYGVESKSPTRKETHKPVSLKETKTVSVNEDDQIDSVLFENAASSSSVTPAADLKAQEVGGEVIRNVPKKVSTRNAIGVSEDEIDRSKLGTGKKRKHVRRRKYKRECKKCYNNFETKHTHVFYCSKCLRHMAG